MNQCLILIDIQNDYFPGGEMELFGAVEAAERAAAVLSAARNSKIPVIHVRHLSNRPDASFFIPGTVGSEIHERVTPLPGEDIIIKHFPNSFRETSLSDLLKTKGIERILVCGMMTHMCVDATVRAAVDLGYQCIVAADACATRDLVFNERTIPAPDVHAAFLAALTGLYAQVVPASSVIQELSK